MKTETKVSLAEKVIALLSQEAIEDVDKKKVLSCAYGMIRTKVGIKSRTKA